MHDLLWDLLALCKRCKEGSYSYQRRRSNTLLLAARQLTTPVTRCLSCQGRAPRGLVTAGCGCWEPGLGYEQMRMHDIERRHSRKLYALWVRQGLTPETICNRYAHLRWWCAKVNKPEVIPPTNAFIKGVRQSEVATVSKAQTLTAADLARVEDPWIQLALEVQQAFGLRCEESLLLRPHRADQGEALWLKGSWCKGGRPRGLPITTAAQREVLERAKAFVGHKDAALIPPGKTLAQQRRRYYYIVAKAGLRTMHGLRHGFAQQRYEDLSGLRSPLQGGPGRRELTEPEREREAAARQQVSEELGHGRRRVTATYIGSRR